MTLQRLDVSNGRSVRSTCLATTAGHLLLDVQSAVPPVRPPPRKSSGALLSERKFVPMLRRRLVTSSERGTREGTACGTDPRQATMEVRSGCAAIRTFLAELLLRCLDLVVDGIFWLVYCWRRKSCLAPIADRLLLRPAVELAHDIRHGKIRSADVVRAYINRIEQVDPLLNAVVDGSFQEAIEEAQKVDELVKQGVSPQELEVTKPFLGVPFITKNSVGVKGCLIDLGVPNFVGERATEDARVIQQLKEAGAIFVAITNTPQQCLWTESYNKVHGRSRNPYDTRTTCGGSSGGEGSLLGAGAALIGVATDIAGSIRIPAVYCGVFGHTPTPGIVSNAGHRHYFSDVMMEHYVTGPMSRYASDLLPLFRVMAGPSNNQMKLDHQVDLRAIKLYYMEDEGCRFFTRVHKDMRSAVTNVVKHFKEKHGTRVEQVNLSDARYGFEMWLAKLSAASQGTTLQTMNADGKRINTFLELLKSCACMSRHTFPSILLTILETKLLPKPTSNIVQKFLQMADNLTTALKDTLGEDGVLIYPGNMEPAPYHNMHTCKIGVVGYTAAFNVAKVPATGCPVGRTKDGRPVGVQVVAGPYQDHLCLAVASEIEKAFGGWQSPCSIQCDCT
ncbi:fatty-acid amide hydrolase 2-like [Ornithodoros turicata]|uniref:fatty-acid amide hydrolase 2-like n=1 Tax=Ornithodoros turicata TaxID=34597 RepID=UPI003139CA25